METALGNIDLADTGIGEDVGGDLGLVHRQSVFDAGVCANLNSVGVDAPEGPTGRSVTGQAVSVSEESRMRHVERRYAQGVNKAVATEDSLALSGLGRREGSKSSSLAFQKGKLSELRCEDK